MAVCSGVEGGRGLLAAHGSEGMTRWHRRMTAISLFCLDCGLSLPAPAAPAHGGHKKQQEFPAAPSCSEPPPHGPRGCSKPRSPGRLPSRQGSPARPFGQAARGEAEVPARIRQQSSPALPPPPSQLLPVEGAAARGSEQAPAPQERSRIRPEELLNSQLGRARRCPVPGSSQGRNRRVRAQAGEAERQWRLPLPGLAGSCEPPGTGHGRESRKLPALNPSQREAPFTSGKNRPQRSPKQHGSETPAAPPSTNPPQSAGQQRFHPPQSPARVGSPPSHLKQPTASTHAHSGCSLLSVSPHWGLSPTNPQPGAGCLPGGVWSSPDHRLSHPFDVQAGHQDHQELCSQPHRGLSRRGLSPALPWANPPPPPSHRPQRLEAAGCVRSICGTGLGAFLQGQQAKELPPSRTTARQRQGQRPRLLEQSSQHLKPGCPVLE